MSVTAPIDPATLEPALRPFGTSTMLPAVAYIDPAVLGWERRHAFAAGWTCLGRTGEVLPAGTNSRGATVGDIPVLLTRSGGLRAFANTCPHRGHELLPDGGTGTARSVVCPYHAWSFGLDGRLIGAPRMRDVPGFEESAAALVPLPVEDWHGWLLVNATGTAALTEYLGDLDRLVSPYRPAGLRLGARHEYTVRANWKVIVENYHECYHCPLIHPELCKVTPPDSGDNHDLPGAWVGGSMELRDGAATMSISGASLGSPIEGADPRRVEYLALFPNLLLSLHPDYVMTHRLVPLTVDLTWIECSWLFPPAAWQRPGFDPGYASEFWDLTNAEDWAACESVQRGLGSPHFRPGPLAPGEDAVHQWVRLVARLYQGFPPHRA